MEREADVDAKISEELKLQKTGLRGVKDKYDSLSKSVDALEKSVEQQTPTRARESDQSEDAVVQLW